MQASIVLHPQASLDIYIYSLIAYHIGVQLIYSLLEMNLRTHSKVGKKRKKRTELDFMENDESGLKR